MFNFNGEFLGRVVDVKDPKKEGRIKVKVFTAFDELDSESIPWAYPTNNITGGSFTGGGFLSLPKIGSIVRVTFERGDVYKPYWSYNLSLSENLKAKLSDDFYDQAHSVIYDEETRTYIYKTKEEGIVIKNTENLISVEENRVRIKQISLAEREPKKFDEEYVEGEEFPLEELSPDEPSNRTENEVVLENDSISIFRHVGGKDSPSKVNSIKITDDKITAEVNGNFIDLTEVAISLGKLNESEYHAVLFEKLKEWQENLINTIGNLDKILTPSGPTLQIKTAVNWFKMETLKNQIEQHKSENVTLKK